MFRKITGMAAELAIAGLALAGAAPAHAAAGPAPTVDLSDIGRLVDGIVPAQLTHDQIPGAAVVVVQGGKEVFAKGYGVANVSTRTPVSPDSTEFFTGSVAKLFTATAAAQLIQAGKLDPNADVNSYLKTFQIRNTYPGRPVTLADLLTHTSGFDDDPVGAAVSDPADVPQLGRYLADHQPARVRPPGTMAAYDNYGVALAGYLVEITSGEPFAQYVQDHILNPLGMSATTFAQPHPAPIDARLATGYRPEGSGQAPEKGQYGAWAPTGAGTVATADDLGKFMIAQLDADPRLGGPGVTTLIQQQHFTESPQLPGMGYLFQQQPRNGQPLLFKDGDVPGFHSNLALLPNQGIGIYVVYNGDGANGVANWDGKALIDSIVDRYLPDTRPFPPVLSHVDSAAYAGDYRVDRTSHSAVTKAAALVAPVTVSADADGGVTTGGLSPDPNAGDQHWLPIGPGLYQERGGQDRIRFDDKGDLFTTMDPTVAYQKLPWYSSPFLHEGILALGLLILLAGFLAFPAVALVRWRRGLPAHSAGARAARLTAWLTGALAIGFLTGFLMLTSDGNAFNETVILDSAPLTAVLALNAFATATTLGVIAGTVAAWTRGWWTRIGRIGYTLVAVGAIAYLAVAHVYNLVPSLLA